ncbi:hypothetical protein FBQ85_27045 [Cytophagia bacterium CHB2]|nr:hypothetical protein [Cytophagia bacterium CHB2]
MKTTFCLLAFCHMLLWTTAAAQGADSLNWFPYKTGDMWEYRAFGAYPFAIAQIINVKDSVSADGKIHLTQLHRFIYPVCCEDVMFFPYVIDTAAAEVIGPSDELRNVPVYKFNVEEGDQWLLTPRGETATVMGIKEGSLFDRNTTFMEIRYDNGTLVRYGVTLARGFGLIYRGGGDQAWSYNLEGAVINGVLYGDTTGIPLTVDDKNEHFIQPGFELHQNYPNPFNPATAITFDLKTSGSVTLIIYDMMGREIRRLVDDEGFIPGPHKIIWDGRANSGEIAAAGIYHYRLLHNNEIVTRSMIFLK